MQTNLHLQEASEAGQRFNMKKLFLILSSLVLISSAYAYDRDYTKIQKKHIAAEGEHFDFRDVFGNPFTTVLNPDVERNDFKKENFVHDGHFVTYKNDRRYISKQGIDISRHDGEVDWQKLKDDGIEFVILRIGYRGYQSGKLKTDENFHKNIQGALKAGLEVGVYVFSQAKNDAEAIEEADLVINELKNYQITLPVFYDPEIIRDDKARSDHITGERFTKNAVLFCEKIKKAGYEPGVYSNMLWEAYEFDLTKFKEYWIWYADYEEIPQTPYHFSFWQYAEKDGETKAPYDMDIMLVPVKY